MHQRKVQNIAGMTFTVSLPKEWVKKNNIAPKSTVMMVENDDGTLLLSPNLTSSSTDRESISFNIDKQESNISHILYATYYMGYENIRLFSKKEIQPTTRSKIKHTISNLSGVEVIFEDLNRIDMKVLLDISKTDINQILFRINLIISSCIDILLSKGSADDVQKNEDEVDRLYHLVRKMIFLSSRDSAVLQNSGINHISHAFSYSMINNKMEIIADNLAELGDHLLSPEMKNKDIPKTQEILRFFQKRCARDIGFLVKDRHPPEHAQDMTEIGKVKDKIPSLNDPKIRIHLLSIAGLIVEIEEEIMNLSYYRRLKESSA
jgi:phosphate transport system protein